MDFPRYRPGLDSYLNLRDQHAFPDEANLYYNIAPGFCRELFSPNYVRRQDIAVKRMQEQQEYERWEEEARVQNARRLHASEERRRAQEERLRQDEILRRNQEQLRAAEARNQREYDEKLKNTADALRREFEEKLQQVSQSTSVPAALAVPQQQQQQQQKENVQSIGQDWVPVKSLDALSVSSSSSVATACASENNAAFSPVSSALPPPTPSPLVSAQPLPLPLPAKEKEQAQDKSCVVCMDRERNVVCFPCTHFILCFECSGGLKQCPMCKDDAQMIKCIVS